MTTVIVGLEIHEAASMGDYDSLKECIKSGRFDLNAADEDWGNKTALHWACQKGFVDCARLLLDSGANGTARTDTGWTAAHFAAEAGKLTSLRALHAADVPVGELDIYGCSPRRLAEIYGHQECVRFLQQVEGELSERRAVLGIHDSADKDEGTKVTPSQRESNSTGNEKCSSKVRGK